MNKFLNVAIGLFGLSFVIIIHELGHFIACKIFGIATPLFSIGFGPRLIGYRIGTTMFQIAMIPFGGFVAIEDAQMALAPYWIKAVILLAGVAINFLFAYIVFWFFKMRNVNVKEIIEQATQHTPNGFMGPIGIIRLISFSASLGLNHFLLILGGLSMSIGIFNLLPIPFLDGGQLAIYTIEAITGPLSGYAYNLTSFIFLLLFLLFIFLISVGDMRKIIRK